MSQNVYHRSLIGDQSGVQVNMPVDRTDRQLPALSDQTFAVAGRFTRGRIDRPFLVIANKLQRYLGKSQSVKKNPAAMTYIQIHEAFGRGAAAAVVSRIVSPQATNQWIVFLADKTIELAVELEDITDPYLVAVKVADCINEGVYAAFTVETADTVHIEIRERKYHVRSGAELGTGELLYHWRGSLDMDAVDSMGVSRYIEDEASRLYGDYLQVSVPASLQEAPLALTPSAKVGLGVVTFRDLGSIGSAEYTKAATALGKTPIKYACLMSDTANVALVYELAQVAIAQNRKLWLEIDGALTPEAAVQWLDNFEFDDTEAMYIGSVWTPLKRNDLTNRNGNLLLGSVGQKVGYYCARNGQRNSFGLPDLHKPIAGVDYKLNGYGFTQIYEPSQAELAMLADARINPCIFQEYHNSDGYVWADALSGSKKSGISKLESSADIAIWFQHYFGRFGKSVLIKPMTDAIKITEKEIEKVCKWAVASGWLVPSASLGGSSYLYNVQPSERYPDDELMMSFDLGINGVVRRFIVDTNMYSTD